MSSLTTSCSLCSFACDEYKCLYDAGGESSAVYEVVTKYFHSSLLDDARTEATIKAICLECWQQISDFHNFQQWILNARRQDDSQFLIKQEDPSDQTTDFEINPTIRNTKKTNVLNLTPTGYNDFEGFSKEINMFECSYCKELFQSYKALDVHFKLCQSNEKLNVKLNFFERKIVKIINERDNNTFKCETCEASFSQYGNLRRHIRKQHAVQPMLKWICKYCNKLFKKKSLLERHKSIHKQQQPSDKSQKTVDDKENNVKSLDAEKSKIFQEVLKVDHSTGSSFSSGVSIKHDSEDEDMELKIPGDLKSAEISDKTQIHTPALDIIDVKSEIATDEGSDDNTNSNDLYSESDKQIDIDLEVQNAALECPRCSHIVRNYIKLKEHFNIKHPDERCYINCCHITLYEQESILEHLKFHKNPKAFKCSECGKCFKGGKGLSSHKLQVHSDNRSTYHLHLCCCKTGVEQHEKKLAQGQQMEYDTRVCCQRKKKILEDDELISKWRQELTCEICKANFPYYSMMRSHSYYAHPGEKCYILCCQRKMSRISDTLEHIRFHLNPHLYRCQKCNIDFSGKSTLAKHMRNAHRDWLPKHRWACDECDKTFEIRQILTRHKNVCHSKKISIH